MLVKFKNIQFIKKTKQIFLFFKLELMALPQKQSVHYTLKNYTPVKTFKIQILK